MGHDRDFASWTVCRLPEDLTTADTAEQHDCPSHAGTPIPLIEIRARSASAPLIPRDDQALGELETRGPC